MTGPNANDSARRDGLRPVLDGIDGLCRRMSVISSLTLLAMCLIVGFEVASRYAFNSPTIWAWDINVQLMLLMLMFGIAEAYRRDMHVRVDVLTTALSPRTRAWLEVGMAPVFFFITIVIVWTGWEYFLQSWTRNQTASTMFAPLLWPIKFTIPLGAAVLTLQGLAKLVRDLRVALGRTGTEAS